ncbi:MAG: tyrosine-type recombinase/integrase [Acidobacteria bacterium]|nr:tyrosine-type recombinase/integrase [Acidobacteriota bacterium]
MTSLIPILLNLDNLATREIRPLLKAAGLKFYGWHAFRRGLATNLIALGVGPKTVQAILRHSNVQTTLNLYAKSIPEQAVRAMRNLEELFTQCSPTQTVN